MIWNGVITQVKQYADTPTHIQLCKAYSSEISFLQPDLSVPLQLTVEDGSLKAEVIQALKLMELNMLFASANGSGKSFATQFLTLPRIIKWRDKDQILDLNWDILNLHSVLLEDVKNMAFSFHSNETTTSQIKKQYNSSVTYYQKQDRKVVTQYIGSLFLGLCCKYVDLLDHFFKYRES